MNSGLGLRRERTGGSLAIRLTEQNLLEGVGAEPEPQGLERDDLFGRDVPEVDLGPETTHEPGLRSLGRSLEDDVARLDPVDDLVDQAGADLAGGPEDTGGAGLARLGNHLPRARLELFSHPFHPLV